MVVCRRRSVQKTDRFSRVLSFSTDDTARFCPQKGSLPVSCDEPFSREILFYPIIFFQLSLLQNCLLQADMRQGKTSVVPQRSDPDSGFSRWGVINNRKKRDSGAKAQHSLTALSARLKSCPDASCNLHGILQAAPGAPKILGGTKNSCGQGVVESV